MLILYSWLIRIVPTDIQSKNPVMVENYIKLHYTSGYYTLKLL